MGSERPKPSSLPLWLALATAGPAESVPSPSRYPFPKSFPPSQPSSPFQPVLPHHPHPSIHITEGAVRYAVPEESSEDPVERIAVCCGSGASMLSSLKPRKGDLFLTGEMSHHEIRKATVDLNIPVILTEHTTMERAFFYGPFRERLLAALGPGAQAHVPPEDADPVKFFHNSTQLREAADF